MAEATAIESPAAGPGPVTGPVPVGATRAWLRFFRSELRQVFLRRRNLLLLAVVALFPILIGVGLRLASHPRGGGGGGAGAACPSSPSSPGTGFSSASSP